jgi:hypothetical protein
VNSTTLAGDQSEEEEAFSFVNSFVAIKATVVLPGNTDILSGDLSALSAVNLFLCFFLLRL